MWHQVSGLAWIGGRTHLLKEMWRLHIKVQLKQAPTNPPFHSSELLLTLALLQLIGAPSEAWFFYLREAFFLILDGSKEQLLI